MPNQIAAVPALTRDPPAGALEVDDVDPSGHELDRETVDVPRCLDVARGAAADRHGTGGRN